MLWWAATAAAQTAAPPPALNPGGTILFERAEFLQSPSLTPPRDATWTEVALPDSWRKMGRPIRDYGWYRLVFRMDGPLKVGQEVAPYAIYISRITNNIEVFLNGSSFAVSGRIDADPEESWNVAQYHIAPLSLFKTGENELLIRLHPDNYSRAGIAPIYLGDALALKPRFERRYFVQTTVPQLITILVVVMAAFSLTIWLHRRRETMFLLFGLMSAVAAIRLLHHYLRDMPWWLALLAVPALCWLTVLQFNFTLHYAGRPMPRLERTLLWSAGVLTLMTVVAALTGWYFIAVTIAYAALAIAALPLCTINVMQLARNPSTANLFMILAVVLNTAFGVHDFLNYREMLGFDRLYLLPWGLPLILLAVAGLLAQRFISTLASYESLNTDLVQRVRERERDLTASYERERELDQQRVAAEERQRLMRDMHDGIGSYLMSTLALARHRKLSQQDFEATLEDCIDELKLTIDSLEPVERDLLLVLGNLRYRLEPRLNAAGISLEWAVQDLPQLTYLDTENVRSILHIVQEALTNTLKHAKATRITVSTGVDLATQRVLVRLTDDGHGRHPDARPGRGLGNMRSRASKLGGHVEIVDLKGGGTCVNLYLPLR